MRILLDECVHWRLRDHFQKHQVVTTKYAGLAGLKNGRLLSAAEGASFEVLVTVDQHIHEQQNRRRGLISIVMLRAKTNRLSDLLPLMPDLVLALETIKSGEAITIG